MLYNTSHVLLLKCTGLFVDMIGVVKDSDAVKAEEDQMYVPEWMKEVL